MGIKMHNTSHFIFSYTILLLNISYTLNIHFIFNIYYIYIYIKASQLKCNKNSYKSRKDMQINYKQRFVHILYKRFYKNPIKHIH